MERKDEDCASQALFEVIEFLYDIRMEDLPKHLQLQKSETQSSTVSSPSSSSTSSGEANNSLKNDERIRQVYREIERIRAIRLDNLMRLWAIQSIIYDKPEKLLVNASDSGSNKNKNPGRVCVFCRKNGEPPVVYEGHRLRGAHGKITCPILAKHACEICGATGQEAHTQKYCPQNTQSLQKELPTFRLMANGALSTSHNHK